MKNCSCLIDGIFESFVLIVFGKNNSERKLYIPGLSSVCWYDLSDKTVDIQSLKNIWKKLKCNFCVSRAGMGTLLPEGPYAAR